MRAWQLVVALIVLGAIQIGCNYWLRPKPAIAERVERIHLDVTNGLVYATLGTHGGGSTTIGMTPRAAVQLQLEIGHMAALAERSARKLPQL